MPPDRELNDAVPGETPTHEQVQQLIEAERGLGTQGVRRVWQASNSSKPVLTSDANGVKISRDDGTTAPAGVIVVGSPAGGFLTGSFPNPSLATNSVGAAQIVDGSVGTAELADGAVTNAKLADAAVANAKLAPNAVTTDKIADGTIGLADLAGATIDALVPPGTVWPFAGAVLPAGWLLCDGTGYSRAAYPKLFAAITGLYGVPDVNTFQVPDLRGRMPMGVSATHPLASAGGSETAPGPAHTHPGGHAHGLNLHTHGPGLHTHTGGSHTHNTDLNHDHGNAVGAAGGSPTTVNSILNGTGAATSVNPTNHLHPVDLPALGLLSTKSDDRTANDTGQPSAASSGAPDNVTTTATDPDVPAASYGAATVPTVPPFLALNWMIRTG